MTSPFLAALIGGQESNWGAEAPAPLQTPIPQQEEDVDPVVGFKKGKRHWLGRLGDILAGKPIYESRMREKDLMRAMEGFTSDPLNSIGAIGRHVDPKAGWDLYNQHRDNERGDLVADAGVQAKRDKILDNTLGAVAGMLTATNEKNYGPMRSRILDYATRKGVELPFDLPEQYDPEAITAIMNGDIGAEKVLKAAALDQYRQRTLGYKYDALETNDENADNRLGETIRYNDIKADQGAARIQQGEERIKLAKNADRQKYGIPISFQLGGKTVSGRMSPDRKKLLASDGTTYVRDPKTKNFVREKK